MYTQFSYMCLPYPHYDQCTHMCVGMCLCVCVCNQVLNQNSFTEDRSVPFV